jgi:hypothetical protein
VQSPGTIKIIGCTLVYAFIKGYTNHRQDFAQLFKDRDYILISTRSYATGMGMVITLDNFQVDGTLWFN